MKQHDLNDLVPILETLPAKISAQDADSIVAHNFESLGLFFKAYVATQDPTQLQNISDQTALILAKVDGYVSNDLLEICVIIAIETHQAAKYHASGDGKNLQACVQSAVNHYARI